MKTIRTFVAVLLDEDLKRNIAKVQSELRKLAPDMRWVKPDCLHITLRFLGDVPEEGMAQVAATVKDAAAGIEPFEMTVSGLGVFPNILRARTVWAGVSGGADQLTELAKRVEDALAQAGFEGDEKRFTPHIAVSRARERGAPAGLAEAIDKTNADNVGMIRVGEVAVMASELTSTGPVYTILHSLPLGRPSC